MVVASYIYHCSYLALGIVQELKLVPQNANKDFRHSAMATPSTSPGLNPGNLRHRIRIIMWIYGHMHVGYTNIYGIMCLSIHVHIIYTYSIY